MKIEGRLTYMDLEMLWRRARNQGQEALAFHLAMGRDVLMEEEFGSLFTKNPVIRSRIERMVQDQGQGDSS